MVLVRLLEGFQDADGYHVRILIDWWCCIWLMETYFRFGVILRGYGLIYVMCWWMLLMRYRFDLLIG